MSQYDPDLTSPATTRLDYALKKVGNEVLHAMSKFPPIASPHEGYAVVQEELDELWAEVKANNGRTPEAHAEARQVAAMAIRYMLDLDAPLGPSVTG